MTRKEYAQLTNREKQTKIAECAKWTHIRFDTSKKYYGLRGLTSDVSHPSFGKWAIHIPYYPNDLNAMHEAEETMDDSQLHRYINTLCEHMYGDWEDAVIASAAQRAEAFVLTLSGKEKNESS